MSRMMAALIAVSAPAAAAEPIDIYLEKTSVEPRCTAAGGDEIIVCGRRDADRYRVPFLVPTPGDPRIVDVPAERARLIAVQSGCEQMGAMPYGCGAVGISVSTKLGGAGSIEFRPLAR